MCRGSRARLTADAATTPSLLLCRGFGATGRAIWRTTLVLEPVINLGLHHGLGGLDEMRCMALNTLVKLITEGCAVTLDPAVVDAASLILGNVLNLLAGIVLGLFERLG